MTQRAGLQKTYETEQKNNQSFAELQQQYSTYCRLRKKQFKKEKADEMVGLIDARSTKVYC
jgi:3-mercaptopyruvate sulfurtransferase SseA